MHKIRLHRAAFVTGLFLVTFALPSHAVLFNINNLVTDDQSAHAAQITDPGLINAWGLSYAPTGPFWVSANGTGTSPLYSVDPATQATSKSALTVTIPGAGSVTGQVFNGTSAFNGDRFLFVSEDGTVSGWRPALGSTAETLAVASATSLYKGAAFSTIGSDSYLYAANFHTGAVDVYKGSTLSPALTGTFTDPSLPSGYAPFNIQNLGGTLYVTYAQQDPLSPDEVAGPGLGLVDAYDQQGNFLARIATGGSLNAPWGLAIAPSSFGSMAGALLVGNFGDGHISAFDPATHAFLGQVLGNDGNPLVIDGLWAISPGNDGLAGSSHLLYFTAGPDDESHGLFGVMTPVPEPSVYAMLLIGLALTSCVIRYRNCN
ncbi:TIGR03118 family protein [Nitrosomonas oligotropha]|uniref:TIGR03118 family protein n=1 Tax=Nitrosomonas oligotropha TaxID=42354 RepID=A0A1H8VFF2_9PROT|nr:TIGR03118 family protein [Nitrosomonas oligotropha]SDX59301.1 TIGR03118 family protein [Nitrosomonas oligotropha]SEP14125.1 TIGR03118 family protein [Nitrosomonas oligotropha]